MPMIESLNALAKSDKKHFTRKRRSLDEHRESVCSSMKSSFINNIFNLIGSGLVVAEEYLNLINKIGHWFTKEETINNVYEDFMELNDAVPETLNRLNPQTLDSELPDVSNLFINHESSIQSVALRVP
ncbi:hypothetical protein TSAR_007884 [Trichomalopsis sarcophagae]|uniref:Uncharacterized protein n=1 Tax=Trichomalopsis sarcophagae TaxID=543379 RepID=A0A232F7J5_9HYME|nr:hypothetical protein TSAR_007884 [Trichomalopsis sarcophagae]